MASPSTVLTLGYGDWGSVNEVPTLGYGIGVVPAVAVVHTALRVPRRDAVLGVPPRPAVVRVPERGATL